MTPTANKPDLRRIGERAFTEVLDTLWSLPATVRASADNSPDSVAPDELSSLVHLTGQRLSGSVRLRLPPAFVADAVRRLTGLEGDVGITDELRQDAVGEFANLVAGRVASQLAAVGYPCQLGTPLVARNASLRADNQNGGVRGRSDLICAGHCLSLEFQFCYTDP